MIIAVWSTIGQVAAAIAALAGLAAVVWKKWLSPRARARRKALEEGKEAVEDGNVSGITAFWDKIRR